MNVVEVFLPLDSGAGIPIDREVIEGIVRGLADRFGGATAFTREPADGLWKTATTLEPDRIIVIEVVIDEVDDEWWRAYRQRLEGQLDQEQVMIRVTPCRTI
jgi:hypothetical protein